MAGFLAGMIFDNCRRRIGNYCVRWNILIIVCILDKLLLKPGDSIGKDKVNSVRTGHRLSHPLETGKSPSYPPQLLLVPLIYGIDSTRSPFPFKNPLFPFFSCHRCKLRASTLQTYRDHHFLTFPGSEWDLKKEHPTPWLVL